MGPRFLFSTLLASQTKTTKNLPTEKIKPDSYFSIISSLEAVKMPTQLAKASHRPFDTL